MSKLVILIIVGVIAYLYFTEWKKASPERKKSMLIKGGVGAFLVTLVILVVTGRLHILFAAIAGALPFLRRSMGLLRYLPFLRKLISQASGSTAGNANRSSVKTRLVQLELDHSIGKISGRVLTGALAGRDMDTLSMEEIISLFELAMARSPDSLPLIEAYCAGRFGPTWRQQFGFDHAAGAESSNGGKSSTGARGNSLSVNDALQILGLEKGATKKQVIAAHRKLIQKFHPDRGGSNYLAHMINEAKSVLIAFLERKG
ncbi:MAG: molecular chaperone DnaJ [Gammaproteobacteria bacterium]|nr:MAG: molecular chaperone DnaJ [Pseudomonadota bacterium]PIE38837.1 MAG: molecular chaperone DnaJ [Gammaproteobacteria bacterium]